MRLIDADAFKTQVASMVIVHSYPVTKGNELCKLIDMQPTAYDQDKVIEMIETKILGKVCIGCGYLRNNVCTYKGSNCQVSKPAYEDIKKVFEELKGGGVDAQMI